MVWVNSALNASHSGGRASSQLEAHPHAEPLCRSVESSTVFLEGTSSGCLVGNAESHLFTDDKPCEFTRASVKSPGAFNAPNAAFTVVARLRRPTRTALVLLSNFTCLSTDSATCPAAAKSIQKFFFLRTKISKSITAEECVPLVSFKRSNQGVFFWINSLVETSPLIHVMGQSQLKNWTRFLLKKRDKKKQTQRQEKMRG